MKILVLFLVIGFSQSIFSSGSHYHPQQVLKCTGECTEVQVKGIVPKSLDILIKAKEVKDTWASMPVEKIEKKQFSKGQEWVVTIYDQKQQDKAKQRLFVFITLDGWLNGANNTGN